MRLVTQTSVWVLLAMCLVLLLQRPTMALLTQQCLDSFTAMATPCDADPKSGACCTALGDMFANYPTCFCDVVDAALANNPNTTLNTTQLREMIVQCGVDASASDTSCLSTLDGASPPPLTPPAASPPTTPESPPSPPTTTVSPPTAPVTAPLPAPDIADSPPPPPIARLFPPPAVVDSPPPPPVTRQSRSPPPPPKSRLLNSPPPPPESTTTGSPPSASSIIDSVLRNGQYCISPNLGVSYYVVVALLVVLLY